MNLLKNLVSSIQSNDVDSVVGIDIGSSSIKVVELEERKGVLTLSTYGEVQLGPYADQDIGRSVTLDAGQEQTALVDVIRESAVQTRNAVFAMPLSSSFVTNVSLTAEPESDLGAMVRVEARKVIPASLSEVTLDWAEVESKEVTGDSESTKHNILIAAIQNVALERFKLLMQFAGLKQPPTEIEAFSAIRSSYSSDDEHIAIIDFGATSAKLYIAHKGLLMRMHRIRAGGVIATEAIATAMDISFEAAEEMKYTARRDSDSFADIKRTHDQSYQRALREFSQVLREYETRNDVELSNIYISGGAAMFPGMTALVKEGLQREVSAANPFQKVAYPAFMDDTIREIGPAFTVALGAALRVFE